VSGDGGRLVTTWAVHGAAGPAVCAAYARADGLLWLELPLGPGCTTYPDLAPSFPAAGRMQRAVADLSGLRAEGASDQRPWLDHGLWPPGPPPLQPGAAPEGCRHAESSDRLSFVRVEGDGVHEIPVGPVHAGIIEPGHFRFSVVGEKVERLEQRLGYKHKGVEKRFTELSPLQAHRLAGRISGDSTVAYAWAYCMALESLAGCQLAGRATWLRALLLERERVANHLGDLGALGNDAAFAFGLAQFSSLREDWLRLSNEVFGHRLMMDCRRTRRRGDRAFARRAAARRMRRQCDAIEADVRRLRRYLRRTCRAAGPLHDDRPRHPRTGGRRLGLCGIAGRASGQAHDLRCDHPWQPYRQLARAAKATLEAGDVAARVAAALRRGAGVAAAGARAVRFSLPAGAAARHESR
jgi:Ni,Fe-hydrogenase III large subunit